MPNFKSIGSKMAFIPYKSFKNVHKILIRFFLPKYAAKKEENSTIKLAVKFSIERKLFVAKLTTLKFLFFSPGSHIITDLDLTFDL